jgi:Na+/melibiose symporter-like transporter
VFYFTLFCFRGVSRRAVVKRIMLRKMSQTKQSKHTSLEARKIMTQSEIIIHCYMILFKYV